MLLSGVGDAPSFLERKWEAIHCARRHLRAALGETYMSYTLNLEKFRAGAECPGGRPRSSQRRPTGWRSVHAT